MWFLSGILLAISLSMDALGIGISYGLRKINVSYLPKFIISFISFLFTALAIFIGNIIVLFLPDYITKLIGIAMLIVLGVYIIIQAFFKKQKDDIYKKKSEKIWSFKLTPFGFILKIICTPIYHNDDVKKYSKIGIKESLYLGVALSIDSFGAGISSAVSGINNFFVPILVGLCQFIFLSFGIFAGKKLTSFEKIDSKIFLVLSGTLLIVLAFVRYFL